MSELAEVERIPSHCPNCSVEDKVRNRGRFVFHEGRACPQEMGLTSPTGAFYRTPSYDFVHPHLAATPVRIHSKRQWKEELKKRGLTDDIQVGGKRVDPMKKPFDSKWDAALDQAIDQSIAEVKKKPYSVIGKQLNREQMREVLRNDFMNQQRRRHG